MLSLTDEIRKFEKLAYDSNLDGVITVEDGFSNGSVTLRDLVKQNHIIITEFKRMKNVFVNYTKLNQKIFDRITEHEVTLGANLLKIGNMNGFFEKTIEGTLDKMKLIYESTAAQNSKMRDYLDKELQPIHEQMQSKVDVTLFNQTIRALNSSQHDSSEIIRGQSVSISSRVEEHLKKDRQHLPQNQSNISVVPSAMQIPLQIPVKSPNKNKRISEEEINNIKSEIQAQMTAQNQSYRENLSQITKKLQQTRKSLVASIQQSYVSSLEKIHALETILTDTQKNTKQQMRSLNETIHARTDPPIWEQHKIGIMSQVKHYINDINLKIHELSFEQSESEKRQVKLINQSNSQLSDSIVLLKNEQNKQNQRIVIKINTEIENLRSRIDKINSQVKENQQNNEKSHNNINKILVANKQDAQHSILDVRQHIDKLSLTLQDVVLKLVIKRFKDTINTLVEGLNGLKKETGEIAKRVDVAFQNIGHIKEVTGRKANYTDIVNLFEKKASKDELTELKQMISSTDLLKKDTPPKQSSRPGDSSRLRSNTVKTSKFISADRSIQAAFVMGASLDRLRKEKRLISKRVQYRPETANVPIFI